MDPSVMLDEMERAVSLAATAKLQEDQQMLLDAIGTFNTYCDFIASDVLDQAQATRFDGIFGRMEKISVLPNHELRVL